MRHRAYSLIELLIVLAIIAILLSLSAVAVSHSRLIAERARCQSNMRQISVALSEHVDAHRQLPDAPPPGAIGGWSLAVLPYMEEAGLAERLAGNLSLDPNMMSPLLRTRPQIMTCPAVIDVEGRVAIVPPTHYVLIVLSKSRRLPQVSWIVQDAFAGETRPWPTGPESQMQASSNPPTGPHSGGWNEVWYSGHYHSGARFVMPGATRDGGF